MHVLLVAPSKVARLPFRLRRSAAAHFQSDALDGVAAGIAVVEVEGREHDGRGGRVHQRVRNIIRMRHVMRAQVEVDDAVMGKVSLGGRQESGGGAGKCWITSDWLEEGGRVQI
jgi:hypothetical protein